jgi:hypothetical protein
MHARRLLPPWQGQRMRCQARSPKHTLVRQITME